MTVAQDASSGSVATSTSNSTATITSGSFIPVANSVIVVEWIWNTQTTSTGITTDPAISDSGGRTWHLIDHRKRIDGTPSVDGQCAAWWALSGSSPSATTVTVTPPAGTTAHGGTILPRVYTGTDLTNPIGAHGEWSQNSGTSIARTPTGTAAGSMFGFAVCDWDLTGTMTAGTGCTLTGGGSGTVGTEISYGHFRRSSADGTSGGTTGLNATLAAASANISGVYYEVVPPGGTNATATPSAVASTTGVPAPTVTNSTTVSASAVASATGVPAPTIKTASTITVAAVAAATAIPAPTVLNGTTVSPAAVAGAVGIGAPTIKTASLIAPSAVAAAVGVPAPTVSNGTTVTLGAVAASVGVPTPGVSAGGSASVMPAAVAASVGVGSPVVGAGVRVSVAAVATVAGVGTPTVTAGGSATVAAASVRAAVGVAAPSVVVPGAGGVTGNLWSHSQIVAPGGVVSPPVIAVGGGIV